MPIFSDEYGTESSLLFLGKHPVEEFENNFLAIAYNFAICECQTN